MSELIGTEISGYKILQHVANGSHGEVYKASHPAIDHPVVLKVMRSDHPEEEELLMRFEAEADVIARLGQHPNIIPMYDFWRGNSGAYLVLKWVDGGTLRDYIDEYGAMPLTEAAYMLTKLADALNTAHQMGIVHRDVKPSNILFDEQGKVYLSDFGIAKQQGKNITAPGTVLGTPAYLAPEQILSETVTQRTDVYSLGLTMYEAISGEVPFTGELAGQVMMKQLSQPLPLFLYQDETIRDSINTILQRATHKSADQRYADTLTMAAEFRAAISKVAS